MDIFNSTISVQKLAAVRQFAGLKDIRSYLNSVRIEVRGPEILAIATDGHCLGMTPISVNPKLPLPPVDFAFNLSTDVIDALVKQAKKGIAEVTLTYEPAGKECRIDFRTSVSTITHMFDHSSEQHFPDYHRILTWRTEQGTPAYFDSAFAVRTDKVARILGSSNTDLYRTRLLFDGDNPVRVLFSADANFLGLFMPLRTSKDKAAADFILTRKSYFM